MTEGEKLHRASEADRLLREPLLVEAFDALARAAHGELLATRGTAAEDDRKRHLLVERANIISEVRGSLESVIRAGKSAARKQSVV